MSIRLEHNPLLQKREECSAHASDLFPLSFQNGFDGLTRTYFSVVINTDFTTVVHARVNISPEQCDRLFDIVHTKEMLTTYPELVTVPVVHRTAQKTYNTVPHVLVNLREEMVFIPKGTILAELQLLTCSINQITTESYMQINEIEAQKPLSKSDQNKETKSDNDQSEPIKDDMEKLEKKFITSPADVDEHKRQNYKMQ